MRLVPALTKAVRKKRKIYGGTWYLDETYIRIKGRWHYLYRAVNGHGETVDFMLSQKRNKKSALRFLRNATDLKITGRQCRYQNNIVEQAHRYFLKEKFLNFINTFHKHKEILSEPLIFPEKNIKLSSFDAEWDADIYSKPAPMLNRKISMDSYLSSVLTNKKANPPNIDRLAQESKVPWIKNNYCNNNIIFYSDDETDFSIFECTLETISKTKSGYNLLKSIENLFTKLTDKKKEK